VRLVVSTGKVLGKSVVFDFAVSGMFFLQFILELEEHKLQIGCCELKPMYELLKKAAHYASK